MLLAELFTDLGGSNPAPTQFVFPPQQHIIESNSRTYHSSKPHHCSRYSTSRKFNNGKLCPRLTTHTGIRSVANLVYQEPQIPEPDHSTDRVMTKLEAKARLTQILQEDIPELKRALKSQIATVMAITAAASSTADRAAIVRLEVEVDHLKSIQESVENTKRRVIETLQPR